MYQKYNTKCLEVHNIMKKWVKFFPVLVTLPTKEVLIKMTLFLYKGNKKSRKGHT